MRGTLLGRPTYVGLCRTASKMLLAIIILEAETLIYRQPIWVIRVYSCSMDTYQWRTTGGLNDLNLHLYPGLLLEFVQIVEKKSGNHER